MYLEHPQEYIGKRYGSIVILEYFGKYGNNTYKFYCECDCGRRFFIKLNNNQKVRKSCNSCLTKKNTLNRKCKLYNYNGEELTLKELAKKLDLKYSTLYYRLFRSKYNKFKIN